jgi:amino acid adenylation domain-containing protein
MEKPFTTHQISYENILPNSIVHRLEENAKNNPDKIAFTVLVDGENEELHTTYFQLNARASRLGNKLKTSFSPGERIVLYFYPGIDFIVGFFGCLYAGLIPIPSIQPKTKRLSERLNRICKDSGAKALLTQLSLLKRDEEILRKTGAEIFLTDVEEQIEYVAAPSLEIEIDSTAFIQYTSGSTGVPKGVMISHRNILENIELIAKSFSQTRDSVIVNWLPFYHDMGLIGGVLVPSYLGATGILLSPLHFVQKPLRWVKAISKYKATTSGGPNFSYELCANSLKEEELVGIDLCSWKVAFVGAETIRSTTLDVFSRLFASCGFNDHAFQPCYGMAEATLLVSTAASGNPIKTVNQKSEIGKYEQAIVSCGKPVGCNIVIVDQFGEEQKEESIGEIAVNGKSVSSGYWNNPELSARTFGLFTKQGNGPYLRTGDLGFLKDGELYVTGRIKDLIIINGKNYHPGDIEAIITYNILFLVQDGCAVFSIDKGDQEELVIVAEIKNTVSESQHEQIFSLIKKVVAEEFELNVGHILLIRKGTIPKTTSGKIQRYLCRQALNEGQLHALSEWSARKVSAGTPADSANNEDIADILNSTVAKLLTLLSEVTHIDNLNADDNIFSIGVNSIMLTQFIMLINDEFEIEFLIEDVFDHPTVTKIAERVDSLKVKNGSENSSLPEEIVFLDNYIPTFNQQSIWFDHHLKNCNSYNIPIMVNAGRQLDVTVVRKVYGMLVEEQEILRTVFTANSGKLSAVIKHSIDYTIQEIDLTLGLHEAEIESNLALLSTVVQEIFDLENGPLFRIYIVKRNFSEYHLLIVSHQIIADGTTLQLLAKEIINRCSAVVEKRSVPGELSLSGYRKYAFELQKLLAGPFAHEAGQYWSKELANTFPFAIPADHVVYFKKDRSSDTITYSFDETVVQRIKILCERNNSTVYMFMLSAFIMLLHEHTGNDDIVVGVPVSNRQRKQTANMLGAFINTVLIRTKVDKKESFSSLLKKVAEKVIYGLKYQEYPISWLAKELNQKNAEVFPFTSVFFNGLGFLFEDAFDDPFNIFSGLHNVDMNVDVNCYLAQTRRGLDIRLDYRKARYKRNTADKLLHRYSAIINRLSVDVDLSVQNILENLPVKDKELERIIELSNGFNAPYPENETISTLIEKQVLRTPGNVAVVCGSHRVSYYEFNGRANSLVSYLQNIGIRGNDFVVMLMDKSLEIPLTMFALMKIGAVFVPMDLKWPLNRINALIQDLKPKLIIYNEGGKIVETADDSIRIICVDFMQFEVDPINPVIGKDLNTPIYGMYTSGTTGLPKCTVNIQKGILNRLLYMNKRYGRDEREAVLFMSKYDYDACVWQIFWPMLNGGRTVVPTVEQEMDLYEIINLIEKEEITFTDFVPSVFNVFIDYIEGYPYIAEKLGSLRQLLIGGEAMNSKAIKRFRELLPHVGITNTFGATEASMGTIFYELQAQIEDNIPIGRPIDNVKALILDEQMQFVPFGEVGELYLGGDCLSLGYLNAPEKTNAVFLMNPIFEVQTDKLYRTGDLVCYLPDGNIRHVGRKDLQVKINGIRVELGEIEKCLLAHEQINEAVIIAIKNDDNVSSLIAYLGGDPHMDFNKIKEYLEQWLPKYMIPRFFVYVSEFPRIGIGKVDKKALLAMPTESYSFEETYHPPSTEMEEKLLRIWQEVLTKNNFGINDIFFEAGGDSLKAMQLLTLIDKKLNIHLSFAEIFNNPTIKKQATILEKKQTYVADEITPVRVRHRNTNVQR